MPDLDQALSGAKLDCGWDLHKQLIEFSKAAKVWMTVQVEYEPINPLVNKQLIEEYLSAAPTRIFKLDNTISAIANPYIDFLQILTDQIKELNAKFIHNKFGIRLAKVLQLTLKIMKYAPIKGRGWEPFPEFLSKKKAVLNIPNNDERCFGYALLYFLERANLPEKTGNCLRATLYKDDMF